MSYSGSTPKSVLSQNVSEKETVKDYLFSKHLSTNADVRFINRILKEDGYETEVSGYYKNERTLPLTAEKIKHCMEVANYMLEYADLFNLDPKKAYFIGLNHDIGYLYGREDHAHNGSDLLSEIGIVDFQTLNAVSMHGTSPNRVDVDKNRYLQLLWCADMSVDKYGNRVGFDKRLEDIKSRYGAESVAYQTARETVDYCKKVMYERNLYGYVDFEDGYVTEKVNDNKIKILYPLDSDCLGDTYRKFGLDYHFLYDLFGTIYPSVLPKAYYDQEDNRVILKFPDYENTVIHELRRAFSHVAYTHEKLNTDRINEIVFGTKNVWLPYEDIRKLNDSIYRLYGLLKDEEKEFGSAGYKLKPEEIEEFNEVLNNRFDLDKYDIEK